jgi:hypothetical protein
MYENAGQYGIFSQVVDTTIQAGGTYTLNVAAGMVPTGGNLVAELILYTENDNLLGYIDTPLSSMTPGAFVECVPLVFTPNEAQIASYGGQKLKISLCGYSTGGAGRIAFDNVRLDVAGVPEPGTITLLASGLIGLMAYAWRKRR